MTDKRLSPYAAVAAFAFLMGAGLLLQKVSFGSEAAWMITYEFGLMFLLPIVVLLVARVPVRAGLRMSRPKPLQLVWFALASLVFCAFYFHLTFFLSRFSRVTQIMVENERWFIMYSLRREGLAAIIAATVGVVICEETFFRGFFLAPLEKRIRMPMLCLISGIAFSGMHLDMGKFLSIIFAGAWFTYVALAGRSIWPGMVAHFVLNTTAVLLVNASQGISREAYMAIRYPSAVWLVVTLPAMAAVIWVTQWMMRRGEVLSDEVANEAPNEVAGTSSP